MIMDEKKDKGLQGNEKIEEAILAIQQNPTEELLAHALTVVRRRMREQGQFIVAVEPPSADVKEAVMQAGGTAMRLQAVQTRHLLDRLVNRGQLRCRQGSHERIIESDDLHLPRHCDA